MDWKERSAVCLTALILVITAIHRVSGVRECKHTQLGREYRGYLNKIRTGRSCETWTSHTWSKPEKDMEDAKNYCRNVDSDEGGPWCFTTDVLWEYCDVPFCQECKTTKIGQEYSGRLSRTKTGKTCQYWDSGTPHKHTQTANLMPEDNLREAVNYCRNPDGNDGGPWCYTTDPDERWEYCDVDYCHGK